MNLPINPWDDFDLPSEEEVLKRKDRSSEALKSSQKSIENYKDGKDEEPDEIFKFIKDKKFVRKDFGNKKPDADKILVVSASLIKALINHYDEEILACPRQIYHVYIKGDVSIPTTQSMMNGSYFETLALGSGRQGEMVLDLPRNKVNGKKNADQRKIEHQIMLFRKKCELFGLDIIPNYNTQIRIYKHYKTNIYLVGELDIFPAYWHIQDSMYAGIIDLKLTGNILSDFGDYCWGRPDLMDHVQADIYHNLIMDIDFGLNDDFNPGNHLKDLIHDDLRIFFNKGLGTFQYWVFGYRVPENPDTLAGQFTMITRMLNNENQAILGERINRVVARLIYFKGRGWEPEPDPGLCMKCPLSPNNGGTCHEAMTGTVV